MIDSNNYNLTIFNIIKKARLIKDLGDKNIYANLKYNNIYDNFKEHTICNQLQLDSDISFR